MGEIVDYEAVQLARLLRRLPLQRALAHLIERPPRVLGTPPTPSTSDVLDWDLVVIEDTIQRAYTRPHTAVFTRDSEAL